ncbi:MAG: ribonuclease HII [Candidatus Bathyarchaeota archaeon]|jgi:ribonuclease HII|nr:ribonuclease HII [Candidatus Bathyarchaeota archaeon]
MVVVAGVDEAGRGPAIGPLVVAAVSFQGPAVDSLFSMGVRDSKALSARRRESLEAEIKEVSEGHSYFVLQPWVIDKVVNRGLKLRKLNYLEAIAMAKAIRDLHPDEVYVDTADVLPDRFREDILKVLGWRPHIVCEKKADVNYPVVSAASILAKVRRDLLISDLREIHGDFGSGYPSDPKTVAFIEAWFKENDQPPPYMRGSWKTIKKYTYQG